MQPIINKSFLIITLATIPITSSYAVDWQVSEPVTIGSGFENDRLIINNNIKATINNQAALEINGSISDIIINSEKSIQTKNGLRSNDSFNPASAAINLTESGRLTGTVDNRGYIRSGINIEGNITSQTESAIQVEGNSHSNKAAILESITLHNSGHIYSANHHAIKINQHGFIDVISIENGSFIGAAKTGASAIYVAEQGQLGGVTQSGRFRTR